MATMIHIEDLQNGYVDLVELVKAEGHYSSPRGMGAIELEDVTIVVDNLLATIPTMVNRKPNLMIAALESLQLITGISVPELLIVASPAFAEFREIDGTFWGAYGTRVQGQVIEVVRKLRDDPDTRQAVITLWNSDLDNVRGKKDYPCTVALGFRIRGGELNLSVTMRSNDVWLGTCYDIFQFTQLQHTIANMLNIEAGTYSHTAWSLHLYEHDLDKIDTLKPRDDGASTFIPRGLPNLALAREVLRDHMALVNSTDANVRWYCELMSRVHAKRRNG